MTFPVHLRVNRCAYSCLKSSGILSYPKFSASSISALGKGSSLTRSTSYSTTPTSLQENMTLMQSLKSPRNQKDPFTNPHPTPSPSSPAYFTGNPEFYSALEKCQHLLSALPSRVLKDVESQSMESLSSQIMMPTWMSKNELAKYKSMKLKDKEMLVLISKLNLLYQAEQVFSTQEKSTNEQDLKMELESFLSGFLRPGSNKPKLPLEPPKCDEFGKSTTFASRKTARAQVEMIPGHGEIRVNGLALSEYFTNALDRQCVLSPLLPFENSKETSSTTENETNGLGKWNIWGLVSGGGKTAQAQALMVAIARGRAVQDPSSKEKLHEMGLLRVDTRQVERKKTGLPKARKKNTWVKR